MALTFDPKTAIDAQLKEAASVLEANLAALDAQIKALEEAGASEAAAPQRQARKETAEDLGRITAEIARRSSGGKGGSGGGRGADSKTTSGGGQGGAIAPIAPADSAAFKMPDWAPAAGVGLGVGALMGLLWLTGVLENAWDLASDKMRRRR